MTITKVITGDESPASIQLLTLTNADTAADVSTAAGFSGGTALPQPFTSGAAGSWTRTFTGVNIRLYAYTYRLNWSDGSHTDESGTLAGDAVTHYGSRAGMVALLGPFNEAQAADIDADGNSTTKAVQEEASLADGDTAVNAVLLSNGISGVLSTDDDYPMLQYAGNRYSAVSLSRRRGLPQDQMGRIYDPYKKYSEEADAMMERFIANRLYAGNNIISAPISGNVSRSNRACCGLGWC